jgi:NAD(P)-dependent dehydrogenase (short-subunit alcohol dehydrogenase family)
MKKVVITGCSTGLGREMAQRGRASGWDVMASVRSMDDAPPLEALGCHVAPLDLRESASVTEFSSRVQPWAGGQLHGLVNNAGAVLAGPLEHLSRAQLREQFETNVFGHLELTQQLLPLLRETSGAIVMLSSVSSELTFPLYGPYSASKRALEALADGLAMELAGDGLRVAIVQPGSHSSSIWHKCHHQVEPWESDARYGKMARALQFFAGQKKLPPADHVAHRVFEILQGRRAGYRHILPAKSRWQWRFRRWCPDQLYFRAVRRLLNKADPTP